MIRPFKEILEEIRKTDPEAAQRAEEAHQFLLKHGPAMLESSRLKDPDGALCGKLKQPKSLK